MRVGQLDARRRSASSVATAIVALGLLCATPACHSAAGTPPVTVNDEWTRTFQLSGEGEVRISNRSNGRIEVEGVSGSTVEIRARRSVRAATEQKARELLSKVAITEDVSADAVVVATEGIPGILIGVSVEVNFHVRMPLSGRLRAELTNGDVTVSAVDGGSILSATNGRVIGTGLRGKTEARVVNGRISLDMAGLADDAPVSANVTNGSVELKVPADANATLSASTVNGRVNVIELPFTPNAEADSERRRGRRTAGQINAGGAAIDLRTVNGSITVRPR